ncbi:hypothetical protein [Paucibacter sp. KCTC 42545]|uniref:hypothetical protein n=1 Tax=Paucibacter sp. KCTC 42545 TaxID=1768242 RepID=UPI0012E3B34B|nr:hypothetical protein [Paucibacter sp. KCTC 42545]
MSIDLDPNWTALELIRERGRRARRVTRLDEPEEQTKEPLPTGSSSIGPTSEIEMYEAPGGYGQGAADLPAVATLTARFPGLAKVMVSRPLDRDPVEQRKPKRRRVVRGPWTAINGRPLPSGKSIKGKIVGGENIDTVGTPTNEICEVPVPLDNQLATFADKLAQDIRKLTIDGTEYDVLLDFWNPYRCVTVTCTLPAVPA